MIKYPAEIIFNEDDNVYDVEFPDLPGCLTYGETFEDAQINAAEALTGYLASIEIRKHGIPPMTAIQQGQNNMYNIFPESNVAFSIWLKETRLKKGMTQKEAAEKIGIKYQAYQRYERPETSNPTLKMIEKIQNLFNERILAI